METTRNTSLNATDSPVENETTETHPTTTQLMKPKTLVIIGNDKGGITKTSSIGTVANALETIGFSIRFLSGDKGTNLTLKKLYPGTTHYDVRDPASMDKAMNAALTSEEDIVLFDFPGFSADIVREYFASRSFHEFADAGLRLVLAVVLTQHPEPISGGIAWVETFIGSADVMLIANGKDTPLGKPIDIATINGSSILLELAENRVVEIPRFTKEMLDDYLTYPAVPTAYYPSGHAYQALGMNQFSAIPWKKQHNAVVRSLSPHAEWLVGKPIPKPVDVIDRSIDPKSSTGIERLKAIYNPDNLTPQTGMVNDTQENAGEVVEITAKSAKTKGRS